MSKRDSHIEQLDNFDLHGPELTETLDSLGWINKWFGNHKSLLNNLKNLMAKHPTQSKYRIVDLGCGGGDVIEVISKAEFLTNTTIEFIGIDANKNSLAYAKNRNLLAENISFLQADILAEKFEIPPCDILVSSHFIYHFSDRGLINFIKRNKKNIKLGFINSGLQKSNLALFLFKHFSNFLPISKMAQQDGQQAIKSAFSKIELENVLSSIPNISYTLRSAPFFRLSLMIE